MTLPKTVSKLGAAFLLGNLLSAAMPLFALHSDPITKHWVCTGSAAQSARLAEPAALETTLRVTNFPGGTIPLSRCGFGRTLSFDKVQGLVRERAGLLEVALGVVLAGAIAFVFLWSIQQKGSEGQSVDERANPTVSWAISQRKQTELQLSRERELMAAMMEHTPDHVYFKDTESRFLRVSRAMAKWFGLSEPEEAIGKTDSDFFGREHAETARVDELRIMETGEPMVGIEEREVWPDGRVTWVSTTKVPLKDQKGNIIGTFGTSRNVTDRKRVEEEKLALADQLRQAQKMEAIGQLAGGIAHDFNNLVTVINGYSEMLLSELPPNDHRRGDLEHISDAGKRAASLTSQLLAFSRKQILQPQFLDLNDAISQAGNILRRLIGEDIDLVVVPRQALGLIEADPGQIQQILLNLAVNARDAMPRGGKLTIETEDIDLDEHYVRLHPTVPPGRYVMLAMSDTGVGMDERTKAHLFEPFFTTKEIGRGTGLGLSTIYGIVKQSNGFIWVYSELGRGTTFKIYFPRVEKDAARHASYYKEQPGLLGTETVLVVEDEASVRTLIARSLRGRGYFVLEASTGHEALRTAQEFRGKIHLLLTDVVMPEMSGKALGTQIRDARPGIKVLFISGYTNNAIVHHGILDSNVAFLQKPFTHDILAQKIREVLGSDRP